ncbi:MAG: succinylglutamate desuccinylase/aspartoacylase family protein [Chloroflexi bacterium]|nr:succinylglutamate desuccinylase/aspartoacylase family protein [Chloroflexota bacterium]
MHFRDFDPDSLPGGEKTRMWLDIAPRAEGGAWRLPFLSVTGASDGPTLLVMAGVHGDEYEGIVAIPRLYEGIQPADLRGRLLALSVCNAPAYASARRGSPIDGLNLARVFPGARDGSITEQIAYWIDEKLLPQADFMIDLHTGGIAYELPLLVGYVHDESAYGQAALAAARAFGAPVLWGHPPPLPPGRSLSAAYDHGVPCVYTEAPGGSGIDPYVADCFVTGALNVMKHLGMLEGEQSRQPLRHHLLGHGDLDSVIDAPVAGLFQREASLLDEVEAGQRLGVIQDEFGGKLAEIVAEQAGVLIMLRGLPRVEAGDGIAHVAQYV